jgi:hypothetical protein
MIFQFTVVLAGEDEMSPAMAEALYVAGCDDGHPWSSEGTAAVTFDRDAVDLGAAIRSAMIDVRKAGFRIAEVRMEPEALAVLAES